MGMSFIPCSNDGCLRWAPQMKEVDAEDLRIDLRTPDAIHWLNDIETGRQYWHWPQTLNMLLQPMFPGQLHRVQRNLYSVVGLIDPANLQDLRCAIPTVECRCRATSTCFVIDV